MQIERRAVSKTVLASVEVHGDLNHLYQMDNTFSRSVTPKITWHIYFLIQKSLTEIASDIEIPLHFTEFIFKTEKKRYFYYQDFLI